MGNIDKNGYIKVEGENGNVVTVYPHTKVGNIDDLDVFGASGSNHSTGLVPDPGATAGTSKYLREDGTWVEPSGGGGGSVDSVSIGSGTPYTPDANGNVDLPAYPTSLPASDVSAWAKASTKPKYTASEVGAAAESHTHQYAGSSSAGGAANSAAKLTNTSKIGNTNKPVYFKADGTPAAISYTIDKSVPSNAVFTDTTYSAATQSASGLMSSTDKTKLDKYPSNLTLKCVYCNVSDSSQTCTYTMSMTDFTGNVNTMSQCGTYIITRVSWSTTPTLSVYAVSYSGGIVTYNTITKIAGSDLTVSASAGKISITGSGKICVYALGSY